MDSRPEVWSIGTPRRGSQGETEPWREAQVVEPGAKR